jgi:hypothetical protein
LDSAYVDLTPAVVCDRAGKRLASSADVHALEPSSGRSALHKAAFWGHTGMTCYLLHELGLAVDAIDFNGDTPLHDAVRFGNAEVSLCRLCQECDRECACTMHPSLHIIYLCTMVHTVIQCIHGATTILQVRCTLGYTATTARPMS